MISAATTPTETILALHALGLTGEEIGSGEEVQQIVYLLDRAGAELGYRFKWDVFGPYSVDLASDLADVDWPQLKETKGTPPEAVQRAVETVRGLMTPPTEATLSRAVWLRLLMCVDFASRRANLSLTNGDRPQFLVNNFSMDQLELARQALATFD
jgi:hypothetical protein